ncbi:MAG: ATP synthase F1 subunit gamma [Bdellovibrionales bacterium RIFOXYD1_FULL_53_11]|nr:MAG: ATP synthase F1 subunit gamma [Bdellovibrionales bacterium RIFOXYD1_FULL_53_11]
MASAKDLRKRISSVKNTQQTTKAMKMVSAAKLRRAQEAIQNQRPYAKRIAELFKMVSVMPELAECSPLIRRDRAADAGKKRLLLVLITSDRGLCAGFNTNIIKRSISWLKEHESEYGYVELGFVGRKAYEFFKIRKVNMGPYVEEAGGKVSFAKAKKLAGIVIEKFLSGHVDEVKFAFNEFKNAISQKVQIENFLPFWEESLDMQAGLEAKKPAESVADAGGILENAALYLLKPGPRAILDDLLTRHFNVQAYRMLLESQAGEHGARMSAMDNATNNAEEMIRLLTLQYNKQRQAGITKELLEIIAGTESQKQEK